MRLSAGAVSLAAPLGARMRRLEGGRVLLPASVLPLVMYLGVFVVRFFAEAAAQIATGAGWLTGVAAAAIAVSAFVAGRAVGELVLALSRPPLPSGGSAA